MAMENPHSSDVLRILFFPFMAPGHMIPMVDLAKLFVGRAGVEATVFTTPANAASIEPSLRHTQVSLHVVPFPSVPGLPDGVENASMVASPDDRMKFVAAVSQLRDPFDAAVRDIAPDAVVADIFLPWTADVAAERGVPRLVFGGNNFFSSCAMHSLDRHKPLDSLPADEDSFVLPGFPGEIKMLRTQIDQSRSADEKRAEFWRRVMESYAMSYGDVVNSFHELEPEYAEHFRRVNGRKAWAVGPVSLCNTNTTENSTRGNKTSVDGDAVLSWLDRQTPSSVIYVCFGSMAELTAAQVAELAHGLEASNRPFVWVARDNGMPEGFEERNREKGLIIRGWAPQTLILNHGAIGCFVTHCGWNSSLEAIAAGLPTVTWPMFAEQFYNERLMVDVLKIGVSLEIEKYGRLPEEREVVSGERIANAMNKVMNVGEEAEERRQRTRDLGLAARRAVEEGGSSYVEMGSLLQELMARRRGI